MSRMIRYLVLLLGLSAVVSAVVLLVVGTGGAAASPAKKKPPAPRGPVGPRGPAGPPGPAGPAGETGPSEAVAKHVDAVVAVVTGGDFGTIGSLSIASAGSYVIFAKASIRTADNASSVTCRVVAAGDTDLAALNAAAQTFTPVAVGVAHTFDAPGTVDFQCGSSAALVSAYYIKIFATKVGKLTNTAG